MTKRLRVKTRLTKTQFKQAASYLPDMTKKSVALARRVLVDGETLTSISQEVEVNKKGEDVHIISRQMLAKYVYTVYDTYITHVLEEPSGWVTETICAPNDMMIEFLENVERRRRIELKPEVKITTKNN